jgi:hypothetical protein
MSHTDPRPAKSTIIKQKRRRPSADQLNAISGALTREYAALDPSHPRRRPTLPTLRFMERPEDGATS